MSNNSKKGVASTAAKRVVDFYRKDFSDLQDYSIIRAVAEMARLEETPGNFLSLENALYERFMEFSEHSIIDLSMRYFDKLKHMKTDAAVNAVTLSVNAGLTGQQEIAARNEDPVARAYREAEERCGSDESEAFQYRLDEQIGLSIHQRSRR